MDHFKVIPRQMDASVQNKPIVIANDRFRYLNEIIFEEYSLNCHAIV